MSRLSANELREAMATCLRELQERIVNDAEPGADERLAKMITTYIDDEFKQHIAKMNGIIDVKVKELFKTNVPILLVETIHDAITETVTELAPTIAKAASVAAVTKVPLKIVMGMDFCFPEVGNQSLGETLVLVAHEHLKLKADVARLTTRINGIEEAARKAEATRKERCNYAIHQMRVAREQIVRSFYRAPEQLNYPPIVSKAAMKIQSTARGKMARRKMKPLGVSERLLFIYHNTHKTAYRVKELRAAVKIQSAVRAKFDLPPALREISDEEPELDVFERTPHNSPPRPPAPTPA